MAKSSFFNGTGVSSTYITDLEGITEETKAHRDAAAVSASEAATTATQIASDANVASANAADAQASAILASNSASDIVDSVNQASASQTAAAASAAAALVSEGEASGYAQTAASSLSATEASETAAATSETNAATSETAAATSETAAATSETNAASSATAASTSATAAAASAVDATTNGAAQVALATTQVTLATTAKTAAELAETNAETAESNAATSATNAATSETNASTSASTASTKATEAATSATNSATSATESETAKTAAEAAKDAALAALDSFDDRYLGAKASDPTLDNDGNALVAGSLYYNTTDDVMNVYEGSSWVAAYASLSGALISANNLSDVESVSSTRTNLGLGTAATTASTDYATAAQGTLAGSAVQPNASPTFAGLTVDGAIEVNAARPQIFLYENDRVGNNTRLENSFDNFNIAQVDDANSSPVNRLSIKMDTGDISFYEDTGTTPKFFWDASAEFLGIGTATPSTDLHIKNTSSDANVQIESTFAGGDARLNLYADSAGVSQIRFGDEAKNNIGLLTYDHSDDSMAFRVNNTIAMRITADADLLVGKDTSDATTGGFFFDKFRNRINCHATDNIPMDIRRAGNDGSVAAFRSGSTTVFRIDVDGADGCIDGASNHSGIKLGTTSLIPRRNGADANNNIDIGNSTYRFDDIYATNGTINTSDANEKQDVADLTATEMLVAARISGLFKTFRWIDSVADKGDNARTHTGVIAQDVHAAFTAEGLDAGDYALFTSATWWEYGVEVDAVEADEEEGIRQRDAGVRIDVYETEAEAPEGSVEVTRMGIRYTELLAFVSAYNEQRFATIEARLAALEAV